MKSMIVKLIIQNRSLGLWKYSEVNATLNFTNEYSLLVPAMTWCHQAANHYLSQCWPSSMSLYGITKPQGVNSLRPRRNRRHFADNIFQCIFLNENERISLRFSLKFVPKVRINNIPSLVQIMAWRRPGDKPLSEPMLVSLLTHICVTLPQWVKICFTTCTLYLVSFSAETGKKPN